MVASETHWAHRRDRIPCVCPSEADLSVAVGIPRTAGGMTNRLGSIPEYGGSVGELPCREAESRPGTSLRGHPSELRTGAGRHSAPVLSTTTYVEATTDDLVKAIRALSTLAGPPHHPGRGRRRVDVQRTSGWAGRQSLETKERA